MELEGEMEQGDRYAARGTKCTHSLGADLETHICGSLPAAGVRYTASKERGWEGLHIARVGGNKRRKDFASGLSGLQWQME
jgi:hypothetical protein